MPNLNGSVTANQPSSSSTLTTGALISNAYDVIVIGISIPSASVNVSSITDSSGNTYTNRSRTHGTGISGEVWTAPSPAASSTNTITITLSAATTSWSVTVGSYSGVSGFDVAGTAQAANSSSVSVSVTLTNTGDVLVAHVFTTPAVTTSSLTTGYEDIPGSSTNYLAHQSYELVGSSGSPTGTVNTFAETLSASQNYIAVLIALGPLVPTVGKAFVTVSPIGLHTPIAAPIANNGCDFGPDTFETKTSGIQEAVCSIPNGGRILLQAGTFTISESINLIGNTIIEGAGDYWGPGLTWIQASASLSAAFVGAVSYCRFKHLIIAVVSGGSIGWGIDLAHTTETPGHNEIRDVGFNGAFTSGWFRIDYNDEDIIEDISPTNNSSMNVPGFSAQNAKFVIRDSYMEGNQSKYTAQISSLYSIVFENCDIDMIKLVGNVSDLRLLDTYNGDNGYPVLDLDGNKVFQLTLTGWFDLKGSSTFFKNSSGSSATIDMMSISGFYQGSGGSGVNWLPATGITIGQYGTFVLLQLVGLPGCPFSFQSPRGYQLSLTIPTNPPVSGTAYQNGMQVAIEVRLPVYASVPGTAGSVTPSLGPSSPSQTLSAEFVSGSTTASLLYVCRIMVPNGWYFKFTGSGVTFGTAQIVPA